MVSALPATGIVLRFVQILLDSVLTPDLAALDGEVPIDG